MLTKIVDLKIKDTNEPQLKSQMEILCGPLFQPVFAHRQDTEQIH